MPLQVMAETNSVLRILMRELRVWLQSVTETNSVLRSQSLGVGAQIGKFAWRVLSLLCNAAPGHGGDE